MLSKEIKSSNQDGDNRGHNSPVGTQSVDKFVSPGIMLFIDQLIVAMGGWLYWLMISQFVLTSEIGHATTIYSLVLVVNTIIQLGLEYPLLKKSITQRRQIFGTVILIELAITAVSIPVVLYSIGNLYGESAEFTWIAIGILVLSSIGFVTRFALLGLSKTRTILVLDVVATVLKFGSAFALVSAGYEAIGILVSFLIQSAVIAVAAIIVSSRAFGFGFGNISFIKDTLKDGLVNTPSKLSSTLIISLSVVMLAAFGVDSSEVGIFYIAMMLSIVVGSFASSLAFMSIPASSGVNKDLSTGSLRIGLAFTAPIVAALIAAPDYVLSVVGSQYVSAAEILIILAAGVMPSAILANATSKFNNQSKPKKILAIGGVRVGVFLVSFFALVPLYGTLGAAYSILISFVASAALSLIWSEKVLFRFIGISILSIVGGIIAGRFIDFVSQVHPILVIGAAMGTALLLVFASRCTSTKEMAAIIASVTK